MSEPVPARLSASVLLLRDDPLNVLMVKRRAEAVFPSALVFPGGAIDAGDWDTAWLDHVVGAENLSDEQRALRIGAYREVFEETGVLVGAPSIAHSEGRFLDVVREANIALPLSALRPFGHWITPEAAPKRFDTHFFLCPAPPSAHPVKADGEVLSFEWLAPDEALRRAATRESLVLFPTRMNLGRLAESVSAGDALEAATRQPPVTVRPAIEKREEGIFIVIDAEAGYGVTEDGPHKGGVF